MNEEKSQKLKKIFREAAELTKELPEIFQPKAFEIVVKLSLEEREEKPLVEERIERKSPKEKSKIERLAILAEELRISDKKAIQTIYDFSTKGTIIITAKLEGKNSEVQRKITYLLLLEKIKCEEQEWVSALELSEQMKRYGVNDGHVTKSLEKEKGKILCSGRKKGKKYGLTPTGVEEAKTILLGLLEI